MTELSIVPAGAGAGKTHHIQTTLTQWVRDGLVRPERILAVTFTEAAAGELRQRIRAALIADGNLAAALAVDRAYVSTIHGLGRRLLVEHALRHDPKAIFNAAAQAQAAADWIHAAHKAAVAPLPLAA